ncbi:MAG: terminase family protein [Actinomycetota bacterium]
MPAKQAEPRSPLAELADLPARERTRIWAKITPARAEQLLTSWTYRARPEQLPPPGDWSTWYVRGGRGSGKTRVGAETLADWIRSAPPLPDSSGGEWAVIAPTYRDGRDTCIEGGSGLLRALGDDVRNWNRSLGELTTHSGATVFLGTADDGAVRIQGKNLRGAWCDEIGLWIRWDRAWNESLRYALRIDPALIVATGTPKGRVALVRQLLDDERVVKTHMRTEDNADNLSAEVVADLLERYGGTRLGRQELGGEALDDIVGALWRREQIDALRRTPVDIPDMKRIVVAIDPAVTSGEDADETGIVVAGSGVDGHGYVLADRTCRLSPDGWASRGVVAFHEFGADRIVAEVNNGGDLVERVIRTVDAKVPFKAVHASRGKIVRAEPVSALYEQGKIHHVGTYTELEDQMTSYTAEGAAFSPDRMDALVWALHYLMLESRPAPRFLIATPARRKPGDVVVPQPPPRVKASRRGKPPKRRRR